MGWSVSCGAPFGVGKESAGTAACLTARSCDDAPVTTLVLETDHGPAHAHLHDVDEPRACSCSATGQGEALPPGISSRRKTSRSRRACRSRSSNSRIASPAAARRRLRGSSMSRGWRSSRGSARGGSTSCLSSSAAAPPERGRVPDVGRDRRRRRALPRLSAAAAAGPAPRAETEPAAGARHRGGGDARRSGRAGCVRDSTRGASPTRLLVPGDHSLRNGLGPAAPLLAEWLQARCR